MPDQDLNQAKDEAKEEVSKLSFKMVKSAITDFTSAVTSIPSIVFGPIVSSVKGLFSSDENKKGFFSNILSGIGENISTFVDKINPFPELIKAKETKDALDNTIESSDDKKVIKDIEKNVESTKEEINFQAKTDAVRTVTNIATNAIPGGALASGATGSVANAIAGGAVSEVVEKGIEHSATISEFTEETPTKSIQEHEANKILSDAKDESLNNNTLKILDSSGDVISNSLSASAKLDPDTATSTLAQSFDKVKEITHDLNSSLAQKIA